MDNTELKQTELKVNNYIALRAVHFSIAIVLTGGIVNLAYNISPFNIILLIFSIFLDSAFIMAALRANSNVKKIIKEMR